MYEKLRRKDSSLDLYCRDQMYGFKKKKKRISLFFNSIMFLLDQSKDGILMSQHSRGDRSVQGLRVDSCRDQMYVRLSSIMKNHLPWIFDVVICYLCSDIKFYIQSIFKYDLNIDQICFILTEFQISNIHTYILVHIIDPVW